MFLLRIGTRFECIRHFDGRAAFEHELDVLVCRLADALRKTWVRCAEGDNCGCGVVFVRKRFERHCSEVQHADDFGYMTQQAEAPADAE